MSINKADFFAFCDCLEKGSYWDENGEREASPFSVYWDAGGQGGGNCWDNESYSYNRDPEDELSSIKLLRENLRLVIEEFAPNLTALNLFKLEEMISQDTFTKYEWYGNYSIYEIRKLDQNVLLRFLNEHA